MILGDEVAKFLEANKVLGTDGKITIKCLYCNDDVVPDNIQFILPPNLTSSHIRIICSKPLCIEKFLIDKGDK